MFSSSFQDGNCLLFRKTEELLTPIYEKLIEFSINRLATTYFILPNEELLHFKRPSVICQNSSVNSKVFASLAQCKYKSYTFWYWKFSYIMQCTYRNNISLNNYRFHTKLRCLTCNSLDADCRTQSFQTCCWKRCNCFLLHKVPLKNP